jgi:hypothetical protein
MQLPQMGMINLTTQKVAYETAYSISVFGFGMAAGATSNRRKFRQRRHRAGDQPNDE